MNINVFLALVLTLCAFIGWKADYWSAWGVFVPFAAIIIWELAFVAYTWLKPAKVTNIRMRYTDAIKLEMRLKQQYTNEFKKKFKEARLNRELNKPSTNLEQ